MKPQRPWLFLIFSLGAAILCSCASTPAPAAKPNTAVTPATAVSATTVAAKPAPANVPVTAAKTPTPPTSPTATASSASTTLPAPAAVTARVDFKKQVQPIFVDYCYKCHGLGKQSGGVKLDVRDNVMKNVIPGNPTKSNIYRAITRSMGASDHMPPVSQDQPEEEDIAVIKQWILEGATWPEGT